MRYGQIRKFDIANGEGIRTSIFVTGCTHHCFQCFNEEYQDPSYGTLWTDDTTKEVLSYVSLPMVQGLTLLGGEPFQNIEGLQPVVNCIRQEVPHKDIWVYSGYTWDELTTLPRAMELLSLCDVLVDGRFVETLKDPSLAFRGSSNQRIIDVKQSLQENSVVLYM